jgi:hypothetical protein
MASGVNSTIADGWPMPAGLVNGPERVKPCQPARAGGVFHQFGPIVYQLPE